MVLLAGFATFSREAEAFRLGRVSFMRKFLIASSAAALVALTGCGGGSSSTPPPSSNNPPAPVPPAPSPPAPAPVVGVATPSSVAVVTATNAQ